MGSRAAALHSGLDRMIAWAVLVRDRVAVLRRKALGPLSAGHRYAAADRFRTAAALLSGAVIDLSSAGLDAFVNAASGYSGPPERVAWLGCTAGAGRYPTADEVDRVVRAWRRDGATGLRSALVAVPSRRSAALVIPDRNVLVDVSRTARYDLFTGIQRVVVEIARRWAPATLLVWWDPDAGALRQLGEDDRRRMIDRGAAGGDGRGPPADLGAGPPDIIVPWGSTLVVPEVVAEPQRADAIATLVNARVAGAFGVVAHDLIAVTSPETMPEEMPAWFGRYLAMVKCSTRLSAVSHATATVFGALNEMFAVQGVAGPAIAVHPLPCEPPQVTPDQLARAAARLGGSEPVVLMVGTVEPRKNHLAVLAAAEELWSEGHSFRLVFAGAAGWDAADVWSEIDRLTAAGRPLEVLGPTAEETLWSLYHLARFTVFPSLVEGYGLPIAESLACGTPVVTSGYGAMADVACGGGALLIDPRDPRDLAGAMRRLLTDDALLEAKRGEALARTWPSWDEYSAATWAFFTGEASVT